MKSMELDICFSPALYPFYRKENDTVIVVDVFRASATLCAMLANGASAVITVADIEEAKQYKSRGYLVGAERNARQCDFADFGNSPYDYTREKVAGKEVVFTTTNGTRAIDAAKNAKQLFVGTFFKPRSLIAKNRGGGRKGGYSLRGGGTTGQTWKTPCLEDVSLKSCQKKPRWL